MEAKISTFSGFKVGEIMSFKNILFNTWNGAFFHKGGGEVQLLQSRIALEKRGLNIDFFDLWEPQLDFDLLHQFSVLPGVEHVVRKYKALGMKTALSTILWGPLPDREHAEYHRMRSIVDHSDILLTNSIAESELLSEYFQQDPSRFHKTRNSVGDRFFRQSTPDLFRKKFNISGDFVLSVGNIQERKNYKKLIHACNKLDLRLIIIGHSSESHALNDLKDLNEGSIYLGAISDEEILKSAYSACSIFALPSYCETPGIAALEAASQGAKILITQEGCTREYFEDNATYVNPYEISSIIEGIEKAMNLPKNPELPNFTRSNYSWDITAREIIEGYERVFS
jgi:glycosyltransferase involved in cell wall biosynthesis